MSEWQKIESAPRDGNCIWLLSKGDEIERLPRAAVGYWDKNGTSWVDEHGNMDGENVCTLAVTGVWYSGGGWFQPNEVTHWMPLPEPPE